MSYHPSQWDPRAAGQAVRRGTTSLSMLDVCAIFGLVGGVGFWFAFFVRMISPVDILDHILLVLLASGYALVLPMLLSLLAPWTQAGMALARTRWKTAGQAVAVAAALFMTFHAFMVLWSWWAARPGVVAAEQDLFLAIGSGIIFIIVPALCWVQAAPDRWVAEVMQAQEVRRLEASQQANLMAAEISYARAMALLRRGLANCTVEERQEVAGILIAMQRAENEAIDRAAGYMETISGINGGPRLVDDPRVIQQFDNLYDKLTHLYVEPPAHYEELPPPAAAELPPPAATGATIPVLLRGAHQDAVPAPAEAGASAAAAGSFRGEPPRPAAPRGEPPQYAAEFRAAREAFRGQGFTAKTLGELIKKSDRTGRDVIRAWLDAGLVERGESGAYYIIEGA